VVPGCGACRFIDVHHIRHREHGGAHELANLVLLCSGHHKQLHDGIIEIRGRAPDALVFELPSPGGD
jgi:5-methylcytosine-specific restriction endonuclease McrA